MAIDIEGSKIELTPSNMTGGMKTAVQNAQTRIDELLVGQHGLTDAVQAELNTLKNQLDALDLAGETDVNALQEKILLINDIFSKDGMANDLFDALRILGSAWNDAGQMVQSIEVDFKSATGKATVDLSAMSFANTDAYSIITGDNSNGTKPVIVSSRKVDASSAEVVVRDNRYFPEDNMMYDASVIGANFPVSLVVMYNRPILSFSLTDEEGKVTTV